MTSRLLIPLLLLLTGCERIPADQAGTLDRVTQERIFRVGLADGRSGQATEAALLLQRVADRTGASPEIERASLERLLSQLEKGRTDLVLAEVEKKSPWAKTVTLVKPPVARTGTEAELQLTAIARNGENRWIQLLHEEAKAVGKGAR